MLYLVFIVSPYHNTLTPNKGNRNCNNCGDDDDDAPLTFASKYLKEGQRRSGDQNKIVNYWKYAYQWGSFWA